MLIDRDKAIEAIDEVRDLISVEAYCAITERLKELPSAERRGKWVSDWNREIKMVDGCPDGSCHCSNCGEWLVASDEYAVKGIYCPNCGARMVSEK